MEQKLGNGEWRAGSRRPLGSILVRPDYLPTTLRAPICILASNLVNHEHDIDVFLSLELILRQLRTKLDGDVVVGLCLEAGASTDRIPGIRNWLEQLGATLELVHCEADPLRASLGVHHWLLDNGFETVIGVGSGAILFWALEARRLGTAHQLTRIGLILHQPSVWRYEQRAEFVSDHRVFVADWMERSVCEHADEVWSFQRGLRKWLEYRRWAVERIEFLTPVWPYRFPGVAPERVKRADRGSGRTLYFLGAIDPRQGLRDFVELLDQLERQGEHGLTGVCFRGVPGRMFPEHAAAVIGAASAGWSFLWTVEVQDLPESIFSGIDPARSVVVNCGRWVGGELLGAVCHAHGVPYVSAARHPDELDPRLSYSPVDSARMINLIRNAISSERKPRRRLNEDEEPIPPVRFLLGEAVGWKGPARRELLEEPPRVSVVIVHSDFPHLLHQTLHSVACQIYPNFEVILTAVSTASRKSKLYIQQLQSEFESARWRIVSSRGRGGAAEAIKEGIHAAEGEYVLILPGTAVARPHMISELVTVAEQAGLDHVGCLARFTTAPDFTEQAHGTARVAADFIPAGPVAVMGLVANLFGAGTALFRKSALLDIHAYEVESDVDDQGYGIGARLLNAGKKSAIVPEVLYSMRDQHSAEKALYRDNIRLVRNATAGLEPYLGRIPNNQRELFRYTQELFLAQGQRLGHPPWSHIQPERTDGNGARGASEHRRAIFQHCEQLGRIETGLLYILPLFDHAMGGSEFEEELISGICRLDIRGLAFFRREVASTKLRPESRVLILALCARTAAALGDIEELEGALAGLAELDTSAIAIFRKLQELELPLDEDETALSIAARLEHKIENRGLSYLLLRSVASMHRNKGNARAAAEYSRRAAALESLHMVRRRAKASPPRAG